MSASGNENQLSKNPAVTAQNGGNNNPRTPPFGTSQRPSFRCSPKAMRPLGIKIGFDTQEGASVVRMCKLFAGMEDFASLEYIVQPFFWRVQHKVTERDSTRIESKRPDWNTTFKLVGNNTQSNKESGFEPTESNHRPESCNLSKSHE